jgi:hypothetical protein
MLKFMSSFCNTLVQEMSRYWILVSGCWIKQVIALSYLSGIQHQASSITSPQAMGL